jgi:hypothetical protein
MSNRIKVLCSIKAMHPKTFLTSLLETRVVTLSLCSECINLLERNTFTVNGKSVIIGKRDIFSTTASFFAIVPILVIAWTTA